MPAHVDAIETTLEAIREYREGYRKEMACQIVHDSWHARGFVTSYLLRINGEIAGYGSVGGSPGDSRDTVKEIYLLPEHRAAALECFDALVAAADARTIAAQTNDRLLTVLLFDRAEDLTSDTILFDDRLRTQLTLAPGALFRQIHESDDIVFTHTVEPVGEWGIEVDGRIVATGGLLYHYNPPYGDIFMEVAEPFRRRGFASYLIQELKRICYERGNVPGARTGQGNIGSRASLQRAGMMACARIVRGRIKR
jgi:GNAT superfamily N-acetyltransferase